MSDPTRPDDASRDEQPTLVTPVEQPTRVATAYPAGGATPPPASGVPAPGVVPPSGPVPMVVAAPRPAGRRWTPWIVAGGVLGGILLVGGAFATGFGTGYLVGSSRTTDSWGRLDELGSRMDERMDERLGDRLERLDRDRDGGGGQGRGDADASDGGVLDDALVTPEG